MIWMCHFLKTLLEYFGQLGLEGIDECWIIDVTVQAKQCENLYHVTLISLIWKGVFKNIVSWHKMVSVRYC